MQQLQNDSEQSDLKRKLNAFDLTMIGIGCTIGSGIFVLTGTAAANHAGPAVVLSFAIAGFVAGLAALCYAEMAAMIPISGSAYTYVYATMGELVAWMIGWDLILEYMVGAAAVSVGWSGYLNSLVMDASGGSARMDPRWTEAPFAFNTTSGEFYLTGGYINLPAILIVFLCTSILIFGIRESTTTNAIAVGIKVSVVLLFIFATIPSVDPKNWVPFIPPSTGKFGSFGWTGVLQGASVVFFSYIGFDAVSTTAQECKNPSRDLPIGILGSLTICTVLYMITSLMLTGVVSYTQLNVPHPMSVGIEATGMTWMSIIIDIGALAGLTSVILGLLMGQPRIFFSMSHDGLLPPVFARLHPKFKTPFIPTIVTVSFDWR